MPLDPFPDKPSIGDGFAYLVDYLLLMIAERRNAKTVTVLSD